MVCEPWKVRPLALTKLAHHQGAGHRHLAHALTNAGHRPSPQAPAQPQFNPLPAVPAWQQPQARPQQQQGWAAPYQGQQPYSRAYGQAPAPAAWSSHQVPPGHAQQPAWHPAPAPAQHQQSGAPQAGAAYGAWQPSYPALGLQGARPAGAALLQLHTAVRVSAPPCSSMSVPTVQEGPARAGRLPTTTPMPP